jgi:SAM-dependent methyltransferase
MNARIDSELHSDVACALCGAATLRLFPAHGYWIVACCRCGHQEAELSPGADHVERIYGDAYFNAGGGGYADYVAEGPLLRAHGRRYATLLRDHMPMGHMLDIGTAAGFVLEGFLEQGWIGAGVEPNRSMAQLAHGRLGVPVHVGPVEQFDSDQRFDLVTMIQVLPHFTDPRRALAAAAAVTAPSGWWLVETWNRDDPTAVLFGRHWHEYNPPSVLHWFNPEGLRSLVGEFGFVEVAHGRPRKRLDGAHMKSLLRHHVGAGAMTRMLAAAIPNRLVVPYPMTDLFWALFERRAEA